MVRFLSQEFLLVLHYLFTWPIFLTKNVSSTTETALYNFIHRFGFRQTTYTHNPWNRNWTFTHVKNFSCKKQERQGLNTARHLHKRWWAWHAQVQCAHLPDTECRWQSHGEVWQWVQQENTHAHESTATHTKLTFTIQTQLIKPTATSSVATFETNSYQHMTFLVLIEVTNKTVHLECNNV
jgi:hypothetical protein